MSSLRVVSGPTAARRTVALKGQAGEEGLSDSNEEAARETRREPNANVAKGLFPACLSGTKG